MGDRRRACLRLAVPWLTPALASRAAAEGVRSRGTEWLVARGRSHAAGVSNWRNWLLDGVADGSGLLRRQPAGPCVRSAATGVPVVGVWACARPVHLLTALDHLQLASSAIDLDEAETETLIDDLNRHFAGRGLLFHRPFDGDDWQLEFAEAVECDSIDPVAAVGRNLRELLPGGRDGGQVRALMNEIQMLLHEHPVNQDRTMRGLPAVNSLWLWGFGRLAEPSRTKLPPLWTDDRWMTGIWTLHRADVAPLAAFASQAPMEAGDRLLAWSRPPGDVAATFAQIDSTCIEPTLAWLAAGHMRKAWLLLGEREIFVDAWSRLRCWRRARPLGEVLR